MPNILVLDENDSLLVKGLKNAGFTVDEDYSSTKDEVEKIIARYEGVIIRSRFPIDAAFLNQAKNLKFIGRVGAGLENIDENLSAQKGIKLFNAPEGNRDAVAEHAIGMLLMLFNKLKIADQEVRQGLWRREENRGEELQGKTIGIIGYGNMGKAFAKRLQGFNVKVLCYDILPNLGDEFATQVSLEELFKHTNILSLHTPQTLQTVGMVNDAFIQQFNNDFYLINTARGKTVVTEDLVKQLQKGKIKGACLDVLEYEKASFEKLLAEDLPESFRYLIESDKVVLSPHIAGWTHQSKIKLAQVILDKILAWKSLQ